MQLEVILPLVAYLVVVFGISVYAMRKRSTGTFLNEYFLGSRSMGGIVLAMTLTATYISASSFIGGPGAAYKYGLGWVLLAMIQLPAVWLSLGILGKKFAILARRYNAVTLNDMLFARYQSRLLVWLASLSLLVAFVAFAFSFACGFVVGCFRICFLRSSVVVCFVCGRFVVGMDRTGSHRWDDPALSENQSGCKGW